MMYSYITFILKYTNIAFPSSWKYWFSIFSNSFRSQNILPKKIIAIWSVLLLQDNDIFVLPLFVLIFAPIFTLLGCLREGNTGFINQLITKIPYVHNTINMHVYESLICVIIIFLVSMKQEWQLLMEQLVFIKTDIFAIKLSILLEIYFVMLIVSLF